MKLEDVRVKWTSGAACPPPFSIDKIYHIFKKYGKLFISDGNFEKEIEEEALKNIFTPNNVLWDDIEFSEVKQNKK